MCVCVGECSEMPGGAAQVWRACAAVDAVGADMRHFTAETLPDVERLLGEISVLTISLRRLSEQAERNPSGFIFGHKPVPTGPGESKK